MTPRSERRNEQLRLESRSKLIEHALRLFSRHGFDRTTIAMIAKSSGVSQGLIYHYFENKDELLRAIFERNMEDVRTSFARAASGVTPAEKIAHVIRASFEILDGNLDFWRLSYGLRMQGAVVEALGEDVRHWTSTIRGTLETHFRDAGMDGTEAGLEAAMLFALIDGVAQHYALEPGSYPLHEVQDRIVARYARLASERPAAGEEFEHGDGG